MNFALQMLNSALNVMKFALKIMDFELKMKNLGRARRKQLSSRDGPSKCCTKPASSILTVRFIYKDDGFCITNEKFRIKNEKSCIEIKDSCI